MARSLTVAYPKIRPPGAGFVMRYGPTAAGPALTDRSCSPGSPTQRAYAVLNAMAPASAARLAAGSVNGVLHLAYNHDSDGPGSGVGRVAAARGRR